MLRNFASATGLASTTWLHISIPVRPTRAARISDSVAEQEVRHGVPWMQGGPWVMWREDPVSVFRRATSRAVRADETSPFGVRRSTPSPTWGACGLGATLPVRRGPMADDPRSARAHAEW